MKTFLIVIAVFLTACSTRPEDARRALENQGFTDITTLGTDGWACGKGDAAGREFTARNPLGRMVSGVVCCGAGTKRCTIRW